MKTDFTINVNVSFGLSPELAALAQVLARPRVENASVGDVVPAPAPTHTPTNDQKEGETEVATWQSQVTNLAKSKSQLDKGEVIPPEELITEKPEAEAEAKPAEEPEQSEQPEAAKEPTEEDVRAAMDRARRRIEGGDYKSNATGEGYVKYHRQLTAAFKNIAATLGSEKPSALAADKRASFIARCDELTAENGEIVTPPKF